MNHLTQGLTAPSGPAVYRRTRAPFFRSVGAGPAWPYIWPTPTGWIDFAAIPGYKRLAPMGQLTPGSNGLSPILHRLIPPSYNKIRGYAAILKICEGFVCYPLNLGGVQVISKPSCINCLNFSVAIPRWLIRFFTASPSSAKLCS